MNPDTSPVVTFVGSSGTGKTTYLARLIPELKGRGLRLAVLKHDVHHFEMDHPGKDTYRFTAAGADVVTIANREKFALLQRTDRELSLEEIISRERGVDIHMAHTHLLTDYRGALSEDSSLSLYSQMAIEIMKSVNFYNYNNRDQSLHRVYLCGGGAEVEPLRDTIDRVTHLEIHSAAELIPGSDNIDRPWLYVRAAGCALESIGGGI